MVMKGVQSHPLGLGMHSPLVSRSPNPLFRPLAPSVRTIVVGLVLERRVYGVAIKLFVSEALVGRARTLESRKVLPVFADSISN